MIKKNNVVISDACPIRLFDTAEEAWMWFCFCEMTPKSFKRSKNNSTRPCETSDIAIVVKRLFQQKILTQAHLKVLNLYGEKQTPPFEQMGDPKQHCQLWKQALQRVLKPLKMKGIVDAAGTVFKFYGELK